MYLEMSTNLIQNLSYSIKLPKATVQSEEIMTAVNKSLTKYFNELQYADYLDCYKIHKNLFCLERGPAVMLTEKTILCEINACLWDKALNSAISNVTKQTYPHYIIVEKVINYLLNSTFNQNFGMVEEFFYKLLITHPPKPEMFDYYQKIVFDHFVIFNAKKTEEQAVIFCLIEALKNCIRVEMDSENRPNTPQMESEFPHAGNMNFDTFDSFEVKCLAGMETFYESPEKNVNKKQICFDELPKNEKLKRCLIAFNFIYNILETDFIFWLQSKELDPSFTESKPLLSSLLWKNMRDIGVINNEVHQILGLYKSVKSSNVPYQIRHTIEKLVTLLGELIRCCDNIEEIKYPFIGKRCDNFFRELGSILHQCVMDYKKNEKENQLIVNFKPPWLRLFVCSNLLSSLTGYQCVSELTTVYDILEHIAHIDNRSQNITKTFEKPEVSVSSRLISKLKRYKSINGKLRNGKTLLHSACEENDVEKIKALFIFPELDVNATDRDGWTALHAAANKGNIASVQELISFSPISGEKQKSVNVRARGPQSITPLMCAVCEGHTEVCRLLLQHSGSVLLDDVDELNRSPLDLSTVAEVTDILQYYKKNNVRTYHSRKDISFDPELTKIVLKLCVEMIQAYFSTYRTWDVYKALKRSKRGSTEDANGNLKWDYMRYHRDIKRNIFKLCNLIPKLERMEEFKGLNEIYVRMLSFNKTC